MTSSSSDPPSPLGFGRYFTKHVLVAEHDGRAWGTPQIVAAGTHVAAVGSGAVQYGLSVFEGLKAFRGPDDVIRLFRADAHAKRFAASAAGLTMPPVSVERFIEGVTALVRHDAADCPTLDRGSFYVRPTLFASETYLGVRPSTFHAFVVLLSPVGTYFSGEPRPLRLWAERERVRAVAGGIGWIKTGGNYAASLVAAEQARTRGFDQVLWLDAKHHAYLEEAGTMNVFVRVKDTVYTPPVGSTILAGVTRDSCLVLLRKWGIPVEERALSLDDLAKAPQGEVELWGTGTAAGVLPIGEVAWDGGAIRSTDPTLAKRLQTALVNIQHGRAPDEHGWLTRV
jgi:branched-chain amino acid aminotransferase